MQQLPLMPEHRVYSVTELNRDVKWQLDSHFGSVWIEAELSNVSRPGSGHLYFTLKDARSQLRCAMFKNDNRRINFTPVDGLKVMCRGRLGIYEARGDYQLVVDRLLETGAGALQRKFEALKKQLYEEGLFDEQHKQPLPLFPKSIGLITSPTGAAVKDALNVLRRRYDCARCIVYPVQVQGAGAAQSIASMFRRANTRNECDVLLLLRGGGSLEDLWAFNEEIVARAVFASELPVICGVGHEIDFSIADLVADLRAPTPSAAAELCSPEKNDLLGSLASLNRQLARAASRSNSARQKRLQQIDRRLANLHPANRLRQKAQRCDELDMRLKRVMQHSISRSAIKLKHLQQTMNNLSPQRQVQRKRDQIRSLENRVINSMRTRVATSRLRFATTSRALETVSPLNTLRRGYSIVQTETGSVVTNSRQLTTVKTVSVRLMSGQFEAEVTKIDDSKNI